MAATVGSKIAARLVSVAGPVVVNELANRAHTEVEQGLTEANRAHADEDEHRDAGDRVDHHDHDESEQGEDRLPNAHADVGEIKARTNRRDVARKVAKKAAANVVRGVRGCCHPEKIKYNGIRIFIAIFVWIFVMMTSYRLCEAIAYREFPLAIPRSINAVSQHISRLITFTNKTGAAYATCIQGVYERCLQEMNSSATAESSRITIAANLNAIKLILLKQKTAACAQTQRDAMNLILNAQISAGMYLDQIPINTTNPQNLPIVLSQANETLQCSWMRSAIRATDDVARDAITQTALYASESQTAYNTYLQSILARAEYDRNFFYSKAAQLANSTNSNIPRPPPNPAQMFIDANLYQKLTANGMFSSASPTSPYAIYVTVSNTSREFYNVAKQNVADFPFSIQGIIDDINTRVFNRLTSDGTFRFAVDFALGSLTPTSFVTNYTLANLGWFSGMTLSNVLLSPAFQTPAALLTVNTLQTNFDTRTASYQAQVNAMVAQLAANYTRSQQAYYVLFAVNNSVFAVAYQNGTSANQTNSLNAGIRADMQNAVTAATNAFANISGVLDGSRDDSTGVPNPFAPGPIPYKPLNDTTFIEWTAPLIKFNVFTIPDVYDNFKQILNAFRIIPSLLVALDLMARVFYSIWLMFRYWNVSQMRQQPVDVRHNEIRVLPFMFLTERSLLAQIFDKTRASVPTRYKASWYQLFNVFSRVMRNVLHPASVCALFIIPTLSIGFVTVVTTYQVVLDTFNTGCSTNVITCGGIYQNDPSYANATLSIYANESLTSFFDTTSNLSDSPLPVTGRGTFLTRNIVALTRTVASQAGDALYTVRASQLNRFKAQTCAERVQPSANAQRIAQADYSDVLDPFFRNKFKVDSLRTCLNLDAFDAYFSLNLALILDFDGACDVDLAASPGPLEPAIYRCSSVSCNATQDVPAQVQCNRPSTNLMDYPSWATGCQMEAYIHLTLIGISSALFMYVFINLSRMAVFPACIRRLFRKTLMKYLAKSLYENEYKIRAPDDLEMIDIVGSCDRDTGSRDFDESQVPVKYLRKEIIGDKVVFLQFFGNKYELKDKGFRRVVENFDEDLVIFNEVELQEKERWWMDMSYIVAGLALNYPWIYVLSQLSRSLNVYENPSSRFMRQCPETASLYGAFNGRFGS